MIKYSQEIGVQVVITLLFTRVPLDTKIRTTYYLTFTIPGL